MAKYELIALNEAVPQLLAPTASDLAVLKCSLFYDPEADIDMDLMTVNVTGTPKLKWNEAADSFEITKGLILQGNLTVQGITTTIDSVTLLVEDKNIEIGNVTTPTDVTADGGGIILKASTDLTILWINATNAWTFNQSIDLLGNNLITTGDVNVGKVIVDNLQLDANTLSSTSGDLDLTTGTGGVFKYDSRAFRAGVDAANYLEIGHGGSNSFINHVGAGGMDFRFEGTTKAFFTSAGHLHLLTDTDQKHTLKIVTANNLNDTGIAWENSGGSFTHTIFRTDVGSNRADLVFAAGLNNNIDLLTNSFKIHGEAADEGKLEVIGALQISSGSPGAGKVLTSDVNGLANWILPAPAGESWSNIGSTIILTNINDKVGIGESDPDSKLHVTDGGSAGIVEAFAGTIAAFESPGDGFLSILTPDTGIRGILFGQPSSNIAGGIFYNDPGSPNGFQFRVNGNVTKMVIESDGVGIGTTNPDITSILHLNSTTKGFLPPRMTTAQRDVISSPLTGLKIHNTTVDKSEVFTGTSWKTVLTEDLGQVIVQETFASTNARFFGELALPAAQGWTDTPTGSATIDLVTETVFGEVKQVVRHNDDFTNGATTSKIVLTAQNWTDINDFGASYSGVSRLDTVNGVNGFFSGLQANAAENPLATGNRRYGISFSSTGGNLRVFEADNSGNTITMDGTSGNPSVAFDEWFSWECVIPAGLGAAEFYINGILTSFVPTFITNTGGLGTTIQVGSGSTSGSNRIVFHDNFGVTIFEESATKTLSTATMVGDVAQINIPEGKRDYTIILPDGNPRLIGSALRLVANNLGGSVELQNENPAAPEILYNGLRTLVLEIAVKEVINGVNTVNLGNVYIGFKTEVIHIGGNFTDITDQTITTVSTFQDVTFNQHEIIDGMTHIVGSATFTVDTSGVYSLEVAPQVGQGSGAANVEFQLLKNGVAIVDSGIQFSVGANSQTLPYLRWKERFNATDTFKVQWASDSTNTLLDNITSLFGGANIPSIMLGVTHQGS